MPTTTAAILLLMSSMHAPAMPPRGGSDVDAMAFASPAACASAQADLLRTFGSQMGSMETSSGCVPTGATTTPHEPYVIVIKDAIGGFRHAEVPDADGCDAIVAAMARERPGFRAACLRTGFGPPGATR